MPIVSGNVSLYNETDGVGILPTPTIGAVGLIAHIDQIISGMAGDGDVALLIGDTEGHLGQSALLAEFFGRKDGDAPLVDLAAEKRHGMFVRANHKLIGAATDLSDGGLALAAFEMAEAAGVGVTIEPSDTATLFGEDQARYLISCGPDEARALIAAARAANVPVARVGTFGGKDVSFGNISAPLVDLSHIFRTSFAKAVA